MAARHPGGEDAAELLRIGGVETPCASAPEEDRELFALASAKVDVHIQHQLADRYCGGCPFRAGCLQFGLASPWNYGIYGGRLVAGGEQVDWPAGTPSPGAGTGDGRAGSAESDAGEPTGLGPDWEGWEERIAA